jgi:hypothetical protein
MQRQSVFEVRPRRLEHFQSEVPSLPDDRILSDQQRITIDGRYRVNRSQSRGTERQRRTRRRQKTTSRAVRTGLVSHDWCSRWIEFKQRRPAK